MKEKLVDEITGTEFIHCGNYYLTNSSYFPKRNKVNEMASSLIKTTQLKTHCRPSFEELNNSRLPEKNI